MDVVVYNFTSHGFFKASLADILFLGYFFNILTMRSFACLGVSDHIFPELSEIYLENKFNHSKLLE